MDNISTVKFRSKFFRHRLEWLGLVLGMVIIPILPRWFCYQISQFLGLLAWMIDRPGRRVALSNLEAAFGNHFSTAQRRKIARQSYQNFLRTLVDLFWSSRVTAENFHRYLEIDNLERTISYGGEKKSGIAASIHYGNFEWLSLAMGFLGYPADIVAEAPKNSLLNPLLQRARKRSGHTVIPRKGAIRRLYKTLRQGGRVALLVDLTVHPRHPAVIIDCFGLKTCVTLAHAWLQQRTGAVIVPAHAEPLPGGRQRIVCHPKIEVPPHATATEIAQACWNAFEPVVRQNPAPWLWMYKHWRFKPDDAKRSYPFYSNHAPKFERLVKRLRQEKEMVDKQAHAA